MDHADIRNRFTFHPVIAELNQAARYEAIRKEALYLANRINWLCPDSREKSLAITNLQDAVMWANASIACNEDENTEPRT